MNSGPFSSAGGFGGSLSSGALPGAGRAEFAQGSASTTAIKWSALHDAASVVASLAGLAPEPRRAEVRNFPALVRDAGGWRKTLAEQGIEDLSAVMEPGIAALLAVHARGASPAAPALALWHEFVRARTALLALIPAEGPAFRRHA